MDLELDAGLLLLRLYLGLTFLAYAAQKLLGSFDGPGLKGYADWVATLGLHPARLLATVGALTELAAASSMLAGFLVPLGAAGIIGDMIVAMAKVHWANGYFNARGGIAYNVSLSVTALTLALLGPGRWSMDAVLDLHVAGWWWAVFSLSLAAAMSLLVLRPWDTRRRQVESQGTPQ